MLTGVARAALGSLARDLLAWAPWDAELGEAVRRLADRRMDPPRPTRLPDGIDAASARRALERLTLGECRAIADEVLTIPDPESDWAAASTTLEILLAAHDHRAERILDKLPGPDADHHMASQGALWRFRWGLEDVDGRDAQSLSALLQEAQAGGAVGSDLAEALRLAAASHIGASNAPGADWMVPCLGGRRVANLVIALMRRPALADELGPALDWLERADAVAPGRAEGGLEGLVSAAEEADKAGRYEEGGERLERALSRSGGRSDLAAGLHARTTVLMEPRWSRRAAEALGADAQDLDEVTVRAPFRHHTAGGPPPAPPTGGWTAAIQRLARADAVTDVNDLALLEAAGSKQRAAEAWLARGDAASLLQAHRLAAALEGPDRDALIEALIGQVPPDEFSLAADPRLLELAHALYEYLSPPEAGWWELRLRAAASDDEPRVTTGADDQGSDDPHSTANRLAVAADLVGASRLEAAAAVVAALFKHAHSDEDRRQLIAISRDILKDANPPPSFVGAVGRLLSVPGGEAPRHQTASAMLDALVASPLMAYPLHATLHRAAAEAQEMTDLERVRLLEAWLGVWRATATPPAVDAVRKVARNVPTLLSLAAFRLAGARDPLRAALDFEARYPVRTTSATALADALLTACSA